jgi:hypothetical protein
MTTRRILLPIGLAAYALVLYFHQINTLSAFGVDWQETYYPALSLLLQGRNPYEVTTLHNPVWGLIPLIPFALLGERLGESALFFTAFTAYAVIAKRLGASPVALILFMLSPLVYYNLMLGNIDWLVVIGFVLPPWAGLFLVVLKPQIGVAIALYWAWKEWKRGGLVQIVRTFLPVTVCLILSFGIFGNWLTGKSDNLLSASWNSSLFPYSIPFGLLALWLAARELNTNRAVSASPFFSPYLSFGSWSIAQLGVVDNPRLTFAVTAGLWLLYALESYVG